MGHSYEGSTGKLLQRRDGAVVVRDAFKLYLAYDCLYATRDALNAGGRTTRSGKAWSVPELRRVLLRETYRGTLRSSGIEVCDSTLAIVDADTFIGVQRALERRSSLHRERKLMKHQFGRKKGHPLCPNDRKLIQSGEEGTEP